MILAKLKSNAPIMKTANEKSRPSLARTAALLIRKSLGGEAKPYGWQHAGHV